MFKVFTWDRVLIYGGMFTACVLASIKAFTFNATLPLVASALLIAVPAVFGALGAYLFFLRWQWAKSISFYTAEGVAVRKGDRKNKVEDIRAAVTRTMNFWIKRYPEEAKGIRAEFDGAVLNFVDTEFIEYQTLTPIGWTTLKAVGLTDGKVVTIRWRTSEDWSRVEALIEHEFSHIALNGAGFVGDQHVEMTLAKFGMD